MKVFVGLLIVLMVTIMPIGYFLNIYKLLQCDFEPSYKSECIRGLGVAVPPMGSIAGYMEFEDN